MKSVSECSGQIQRETRINYKVSRVDDNSELVNYNNNNNNNCVLIRID